MRPDVVTALPAATTRLTNGRAAMAGAIVGLSLVGAAISVVGAWEERSGASLHQGLLAETRDVLVGGRYRVALNCANSDNRTSYFMRAMSSETAREALSWMLPVCDLVALGAAAPPGQGGSSWYATWYRGDFACPANFHRRAVTLSASSLAAAIDLVRTTVHATCRIEYADQTHCPLAHPGCETASVDFREPNALASARAPR
mgnify:CR=1 FL=1